MKLQIISDIHLEVSGMTYDQMMGRRQRKDRILVLAGDVSCFKDYDRPHQVNPRHKANYIDFMEKAAEDFKAVIKIPGNHDFWGMNFNIDAARAFDEDSPYWSTAHLDMPYADQRCYKTQFIDTVAHIPNVFVLVGGDFVEIGDYVFIGATMWTNLKNEDPMVMWQAQHMMNDFRRSSVWRDGENHSYRAFDWVDLHKYDKKKQAESLARCALQGRRAIIINHHAPCVLSTDPKYKSDPISYAYANDSDILNDANYECVDLMAHGHIHFASDYKIPGSNIRVVCNPFGYQNPANGFAQDTGYQFDRYVEI